MRDKIGNNGQKDSIYSAVLYVVSCGLFSEALPGLYVFPTLVWVDATMIRYVSAGCIFNFDGVGPLEGYRKQVRHERDGADNGDERLRDNCLHSPAG